MMRIISRIITGGLLLALLLSLAPFSAQAAPTELFFSEYIEGSSYNKALEIYNGTGTAVDLAAGGYNVQMYFNGSSSAGLTINLTGTVAAGDVFVLAQSSANATILAQADQTNGAGWFNGDDAVVLRKGTTIVDVIGQIGFDPGSEWGTGLVSTADNTLQRFFKICAGDLNGSDSFDQSLEWNGFATDTFTGLGVADNCNPKINEFSASTVGTDVEYIELSGGANTSYSDYTILEIEGDTTGSGIVDEVISLGTTDINGFYLVNLPANALENGTISLLLVKNFTGALTNDLDTNNDGTFDVTPWDSIVDSIAVNDGGVGDITYGTTTLGVSYDGAAFAPGGASRIPDHFDTDAATDWVRNDFDLAGIPGYTGMIVLGEAYNTPGASNQIYVPPPEACGDPFTPIYEVQGSTDTSPLVGTEVSVEGIVVGDFQNNNSTDNGNLNGFYIQDSGGDGNPLTSDGIFVYAPGAADVTIGDALRVRGPVSEFNGMTEVSLSKLWICSSGNALPGTTDLYLPVSSVSDLEAYEGMLVRLPQPLVISEYFNYDRFGEIVLALPLDGETRPFTGTAIDEPGAAANARTLANSLSRITLDDANSVQNPPVLRHPNGLPFSLTNLFRGGDTVQNAVGVLGFDFSLYRIYPTAPADYTATNPRPAAPEPVGGSLRVAAMNTLNYFLSPDNIQESSKEPDNPADNICGPVPSLECRGWDGDQPLEFTRQRTKLLSAIEGLNADIVGLNEIENTINVEPLADIVSGLNDTLGAGTYAFVNTGVIGTDAIRVGLIYKPAVVTPIGDFKLLTTAVDPRFLDTRNRPVLAQSFEVNATGARFTVAVNHLKSKGSACDGDPDLSDGQGNCNQTRKTAAQALVDWLATDPTGSGDPDFLIIGDLNSYAMEDPITAVKAGADDVAGTADDYTNLIAKYQGTYAYSYVFDGQAGYLDQALSSTSLTAQVTGAADWHINADEPDVLDYDTSFKPTAQDALYEPNAYRSSDHDAVVIGLDLYTPGTRFATGGGWIDSPQGKAEFLFDAKYKKGAALPTGEVTFWINSAALNFYSNSFNWLVIAGSKAYLEGIGTINGAGSYTFLLIAEDGNPDTLRFIIWDGTNLFYDNGSSQPLGGGQIKIQK